MKKIVFFLALLLLYQSSLYAQLQQTNGPVIVASSFCVYADNDVVFAAFGPELYKSTDEGQTWNLVVIAENVANIDPRAMLRIGDTFICATNNGDRVYRSTDMGATWAPSWTGMPDIFGFPAAVVTGGTVVGNRFIFWGTNHVRYSDDDGLTWQSFTGLSAGSGEGLAEAGGTLWFGGGNYTGYSNDNGVTWTQTTSNPHIGFGLSAREFVKIGDRTYCGTSSNAGVALRYTTDNGTTWIPADGFSVIYDMQYVDGVFYIYDLNGLHRSFDDGATWENFLDVNPSSYGATFTISNGKIWIATGSGPVSYDMEGGNSSSPAVIGGATSWVISTDTYLFAGTITSISVSADNGDSWSVIALPPQVSAWGSILHASADGNTLYVIHSSVNNAPGILITSDGGTTWQVMDISDLGGNDPALFLSYNPQIVVTSEWFVVSLYYSNDDGATFQQATVTAAPGSTLPGSYSVYELYKVGSRLIVETNLGPIISSDGGQSWTYVTPGFALTSFSGWDNRIVAVEDHWSGKKIYESTDGGLTWVQNNGAFPQHGDGKINPVAMACIGDVVLCQNLALDETVANPNAIYRLTQSGDWVAAPELGVLDYAITRFSGTSEDHFYVSTNGAGVWGNQGSVGLHEVLSADALNIYPIPTSRLLNVKRTNGENASYWIFDARGRLVISGNLNGTVEQIDVEKLRSGMYHIRVTEKSGSVFTRSFLKN